MPASIKTTRKALLPLLVVAALAAPHVHAKKDLFGDEPGSKQATHVEQLTATASSTSSESAKETSPTDSVKQIQKQDATDAKAKSSAEHEKAPSFIEKQFTRLKSNLAEAKEDLFGSKTKTKKDTQPTQPTDDSLEDSAATSEEIQVPTISATEAAQRAKGLADGQVINVRKYVEEDKPRYAVKMLQKNGRMKTITLDAVSGALIEDTPQ